jgi:hypothetical protein
MTGRVSPQVEKQYPCGLYFKKKNWIDENQSGGPPKEADQHFTRIESYRLPPEISGGAGISTLMRKKDARHFKGPDPSVSSGYKVLSKLS